MSPNAAPDTFGGPANGAPLLETDRYTQLVPWDEALGTERFEARDTDRGQRVLLELVTAGSDPSAQRGAAAAIERCLSLDQPHLARALNLVTDTSGAAWLVTELPRGTRLGEVLGRGVPLPAGDACTIAAQTLEALGAAHDARLLHLEVRPEAIVIAYPRARAVNVCLEGLGGSAARQAAERGRRDRRLGGELLSRLPYLAPEQALGGSVDQRADIYAVAALLFTMLTGEEPLPGRTPQRRLQSLVGAGPLRLGEHRPDLPAGLVQLVDRCLARSAQDRPESAAEVAAHLRNWAERTQTAPHPLLADDVESEGPSRISQVVAIERSRERARGGDRDARSSAPPAPPPESPLPDDMLLEPVFPRAPITPHFSNPPRTPLRDALKRMLDPEPEGTDDEERSAAPTRPAHHRIQGARAQTLQRGPSLARPLGVAVAAGAAVGTALGVVLRLLL